MSESAKEALYVVVLGGLILLLPGCLILVFLHETFPRWMIGFLITWSFIVGGLFGFMYGKYEH